MPGDEKISEFVPTTVINSNDQLPFIRPGSLDNFRVTAANLMIGKTPTVVVAASNTPNGVPRADFVCDGTDDDIEIQAAIDSLPATGGFVFLLEGAYFISSAVNYIGAGSLTIAGAGIGCTVLQQANSAEITTGLFVFGGLGGASQVSNIVARDFTFDGNKANNAANMVLLFFRNVADGWMERVEAKNSPDIGIGVGDGSAPATSSTRIRINGISSHDNDGNGVDINNSSFVEVSGQSVSYSNGVVGFFAGHGTSFDHKFIGNQAYLNGQDGFMITVGAGDTSILRLLYDGNISHTNGWNGFRAVSSVAGKLIQNIHYGDNLAYNNGTASVATQQNGFLLDGADVQQCAIVNNRALADGGTADQKFGVRTANGATNNGISFNDLQGNNTDALSLVGTNQVYANIEDATSDSYVRSRTRFTSSPVLGNAIALQSRNAADDADLELIRTDGSNQTFLIGLLNLLFFSGGSERARIEGATGNMGINKDIGIAGKLHIDQDVVDAAIPTLVLEQADISDGFMNFIGSDRGVIGEGVNSAVSVRVELGGVIYRLALYADA